MPKIQTIFCDECSRDLTYTASMPAFRLVLSCERMPHADSVIKAALVMPPLATDKYFCNNTCCREWALKNL